MLILLLLFNMHTIIIYYIKLSHNTNQGRMIYQLKQIFITIKYYLY